MPQLDSIPEVLYEPNQPYHYLYDNLPLKNILARISLVNIQTDANAQSLLGASGSAGSIGDRMDVSLNGDGTLKASAVDACEHSIAHHSDGEKDGVEYVRMTADERSKLSLVGSGANLLTLQVNSMPALTEGNVELRDSSTIIFDLQSPNIVRAHLNVPAGQVPVHHYGVVPSHVNPGSPNWRSFKTSSLGTAYAEGSLRVYINGMRVFPGVRVPVFPSSGSTPAQWKLFSVGSENASAGTFELNDSIPDPGVNKIVIDFDVVPAGASSSSSSSS